MSTILRRSGLPTLGPPGIPADVVPQLDDLATRVLAGDAPSPAELPVPLLDFLRWLASERDVLFHGSSNPALTELTTIRHSRDATAFGNQQAVYATRDPAWAVFFAILRRGRFSTRNGSLGLAAGGLYPRWYFFSVNRPDGGRHFAPEGSLYVLPRATFELQPPLLGSIDTAQWVSHEAVPALARFDVTPADFPFADLVVTHSERTPLLLTFARAIRSARARPSGDGRARSRRARAR
jgi:hypothetical protein